MAAIRLRRAFGVWLLGQLIAGVAAYLLAVLLGTLGFVAGSAPT